MTTIRKQSEVFQYVRSIIEIISVLYAAFTVVSTMQQVKSDLQMIKDTLAKHETRITVNEMLLRNKHE